jgi:hypothetical protein
MKLFKISCLRDSGNHMQSFLDHFNAMSVSLFLNVEVSVTVFLNVEVSVAVFLVLVAGEPGGSVVFP